MAKSTKETAEPSAVVAIDSRISGFISRALYLHDWTKSLELLAEPFEPEEIYFLPQTIKSGKATAAAYADSRAYTERMDAVIGPGFWQSEVVRVDVAPFTKYVKAKTDYNDRSKILEPACQMSAHQVGCVVRVGIWMGPDLQWVWQDSTGAKDTADANWITSAEAQAYKRAMSKWGPGRYLYRFPKQECKYASGAWTEQPYIPDWAYPRKYCTDCNAQIESVNYKDAQGSPQTMHSWDVYLNSKNRYGVPLCVLCAKKQRDAGSTTTADQRLQQAA